MAAPSGATAAGYACGAGAESANDAAVCSTCARGFACPEGSHTMQACAPGTYANLTGQDECFDCPRRYFCPGGTGLLDCPPGAYCRSGTEQANERLCPEGTFSDVPNLRDEDECQRCLAGSYCGIQGLGAPQGPCEAGWYCLPGSTTPTPEDIAPASRRRSRALQAEGEGADADADADADDAMPPRLVWRAPPANAAGPHALVHEEGGAEADAEAHRHTARRARLNVVYGPASGDTGGRCWPGHYCPEGSPAMYECPPGKYCGGEGLEEPTGDCAPGYFCTRAAASPMPTDGAASTGDICPFGHYCPSGAYTPIPCPLGTYGNGTGLSECTPCPGGTYCASEGLAVPEGQCEAGYYCTEASDSPTPPAAICPAGARCPAGAYVPTLCAAGFYQPNAGQDECLRCPAGSYCDGVDTAVAIECELGYYCPEGTFSRTQRPCPKGTYGAATGLSAESECAPCPGGSYCERQALVGAPTGPCQAGWYCPADEAVDVPTPSGLECTAGHFCPQGATAPVPCLPGTYSDAVGAAECAPCPPGSYCADSGTWRCRWVCRSVCRSVCAPPRLRSECVIHTSGPRRRGVGEPTAGGFPWVWRCGCAFLRTHAIGAGRSTVAGDMRDGAVEKKWRRVISVGGRTPAPRAPPRRARAEFCNFWVSFYRSLCYS